MCGVIYKFTVVFFSCLNFHFVPLLVFLAEPIFECGNIFDELLEYSQDGVVYFYLKARKSTNDSIVFLIDCCVFKNQGKV